MKKIIIALIIGAVLLIGCSKEEINRLNLENANLRAEKAGLEARMRKVVSERDSILAKYEMIKEIVQGKIAPSLSE
jgi:outer membrane murein-binding lipoprotein Lpp